MLSKEELLRCAAVSTVIVCCPGGLVEDVVELESGRPARLHIGLEMLYRVTTPKPESMLLLLLGV